MRLYIANCTNQIMTIQYRLEFAAGGGTLALAIRNPARSQDLPAGKQAPVGGDMSIDQVNSIVNQLSIFGMMKVGSSSLQRRKVPMIYDIDRPVSEHAIRTVLGHNNGIMIDEGKLRRKRAAVGVNDAVIKAVAEQLAPTPFFDQVDTTLLEVEIEQQEQSEQDGSRVEEGFRVKPAAVPPSHQPESRKGTRRRAA